MHAGGNINREPPNHSPQIRQPVSTAVVLQPTAAVAAAEEKEEATRWTEERPMGRGLKRNCRTDGSN